MHRVMEYGYIGDCEGIEISVMSRGQEESHTSEWNHHTWYKAKLQTTYSLLTHI